MKIIISHDVDHYEWTDHITKDLFIPKYLIRNNIHLLKKKVSFGDYLSRYKLLTANRQHRLDELMQFNNAHQIPATFFIGMRNGLNLSYNYFNAQKIIQIIKQKDPEAGIGVHGIAFNDFSQMQDEYEKMKAILGQVDGIRMHYLRNDNTTLKLLDQLGYQFDSTLYELKNPYRAGKLTEFPVSVMDVSVAVGMNFTKIKENTLVKIDSALKKGLDYFTVIFHDSYFDNAFSKHKDWYIWLIELFKSQGMEFISFKNALGELNQKTDNFYNKQI